MGKQADPLVRDTLHGLGIILGIFTAGLVVGLFIGNGESEEKSGSSIAEASQEVTVEPDQIQPTDNVKAYFNGLTTHTDDLNELIIDLSTASQEYSDDPDISLNEEWYSNTKSVVRDLKSKATTIKELNPPEGFEKADANFSHAMDYLILTADSFQMGVDYGETKYLEKAVEQKRESDVYSDRANAEIRLLGKQIKEEER